MAYDPDQALRDAQPAWQRDGLGLRGPAEPRPPAPAEPAEGRWPVKIDRQETTQPFPPPDPAAQASEEQDDSAQNGEYSFQLQLESVDQGLSTVKVLVVDGFISGAFPTGMTGNDDYFLTLTVPGTLIWAVITYDTTTLAFTSRTLDFGAAVPTSVLGTLYVQIGYVDWTVDAGPPARIKDVVPHNTQCGDIDVGFVYGALNGAMGLYTFQQLSDPVAI